MIVEKGSYLINNFQLIASDGVQDCSPGTQVNGIYVSAMLRRSNQLNGALVSNWGCNAASTAANDNVYNNYCAPATPSASSAAELSQFQQYFYPMKQMGSVVPNSLYVQSASVSSGVCSSAWTAAIFSSSSNGFATDYANGLFGVVSQIQSFNSYKKTHYYQNLRIGRMYTSKIKMVLHLHNTPCESGYFDEVHYNTLVTNAPSGGSLRCGGSFYGRSSLGAGEYAAQSLGFYYNANYYDTMSFMAFENEIYASYVERVTFETKVITGVSSTAKSYTYRFSGYEKKTLVYLE